MPNLVKVLASQTANAVCDQKTSKFFVSQGKESITGHVGVNGVY
jgi:hypothetical protein